MATQASMEPSFFEKLGDKFNAFTEGTVNFLGRLFGSANERTTSCSREWWPSFARMGDRSMTSP